MIMVMATKSANINEIIFSMTSPCNSSIPLLISFLTFKRISIKIASCCSHIPLRHGDFAGVVDIFVLKFLQKFPKLFTNKLSSIITKHFLWTAKNTNPVFKKVLNNNSRAYALNNGDISKSCKLFNLM